MYALIYDEHNLARPKKEVISVHKSRRTAENALQKRMKRLNKSISECSTRIVWVESRVKTGDLIDQNACATWGPGEKIPWGETHSDTD